jgi:hypothetical protein
VNRKLVEEETYKGGSRRAVSVYFTVSILSPDQTDTDKGKLAGKGVWRNKSLREKKDESV